MIRELEFYLPKNENLEPSPRATHAPFKKSFLTGIFSVFLQNYFKILFNSQFFQNFFDFLGNFEPILNYFLQFFLEVTI